MNRDPEAEVARAEREALLEAQHIGTHVIDRLAAIVGHEEVVLAEHPLRDVSQQRTHLGRGDAPADRCEGIVRHLLAEALHQRVEQVAHRREVGVDPLPAIEHHRAHVAGRVQTRVRGDQFLGDDRERTEVGVE